MLRGRPRTGWVEREAFWTAFATGCGVRAAARVAGVKAQTGRSWVLETGGVRPRPPAPRNPRFLSLAEREEIALGLAARLTPTQIAGQLSRPVSTITREIARNSGADGYRAVYADRQAVARMARPKPAKLAGNPRLQAFVQDGLTARWSPQQIAARLGEVFPDEPEMRVSHEAIYQALFVQGRGALRRELTQSLRTGRTLRRPHRQPGSRPDTRLADRVMISERPAEAADRAVPGHWEGDLILGADNGSAIGTLVERTTRFVILLHLPADHGAVAVREAMAAAITTLPAALTRSVTWDQGIELAQHARFSVDTGIPVYFCDPHSPWQRGTNENTNGLLRQYFPKSTDLSLHTPEHLQAVADELNNRPRKTLRWKNPREALNEYLVATTA